MLDFVDEKPSADGKGDEPKDDKDDQDKGVAPKVKNFKAVMSTLVPVAAILTVISGGIATYFKFVEMRHEFKISEDRIQLQIEDKKADQLRSDKERAAHDLEAVQSRADQAKADRIPKANGSNSVLA